MASEEERLAKILEVYEKRLMRRAVLAYERSPGDFLDEASALELVMDLRRKLRAAEQ